MRQILLEILIAIFPTRLIRLAINRMGHSIAPGCRIGFSMIHCDHLTMEKGSKIGHFNLIRVPSLKLLENAEIGRLNSIRGPIDVKLKHRAAIGNRNVVTRAPFGVTSGIAQLQLGELSKITVAHFIDCTTSVVFGDFTTLAGKGSQIWTHGYVHDEAGPGRYRVDGPVALGNNVYIGSRAIITGGVSIKDGISVGAGVAVTRNLEEPGFYVSSPIRKLPRPKDPQLRQDMKRLDDPRLVETVYVKK